MNTLLSLAGLLTDSDSQNFAERVEVDLDIRNEDKFPSLTDAEGWQVIGLTRLEQLDADLKNDYADCAKAASLQPNPAPISRRRAQKCEQNADNTQSVEATE